MKIMTASFALMIGFIFASVSNSYADGGGGTPNAQQESGCSGSLCVGFLTVPFKAELSGNQDVFGSATVGTYVGRDIDLHNDLNLTSSEFHIMPIVFAGYSQNVGAAGGSNMSFVSYGGGLLFPLAAVANVTKKLEFGIVIGFDHTADSNKFEYNDKPWVSALIGINLN